jgi:hypothetical protein
VSVDGFLNGNFLVTVPVVKFYESNARIQAPREKVWAILTDASGYPEWNTAVDRVEGEIAPGRKIKLFVPLSPGRAFPLTVAEFQPPHKMVWTGGMPLGLFRGVRTFTLTPPAADGATDFRMREEFTGPMLPLIWGSMPDFSEAFVQFAEGLKRRAEGG